MSDEHLKNLYEKGEIKPDSTIRKFRILCQEGSRQVTRQIVHQRADASRPRMGLTSWSGEKPHKADVSIAKNYLQPQEIEANS